MANDATFEDFVKRLGAEKAAEEKIDWFKERDEWLNRLGLLYDDVRNYLEGFTKVGSIEILQANSWVHEEKIGSYEAPCMEIKIGTQSVNLTPIGTLLIGSKGRVDVVGSAGTSRLVLINKKARAPRDMIRVTVQIVGEGQPLKPPTSERPSEEIEWAWKIVSRPPASEFIDLTRETFLKLLMEVSNG